MSGCASNPPSAPSGGSSNWDGSSKAGGTIISYTCPDTSNNMKAVCDAATLTWKPETACSTTGQPTSSQQSTTTGQPQSSQTTNTGVQSSQPSSAGPPESTQPTSTGPPESTQQSSTGQPQSSQPSTTGQPQTTISGQITNGTCPLTQTDLDKGIANQRRISYEEEEMITKRNREREYGNRNNRLFLSKPTRRWPNNEIPYILR